MRRLLVAALLSLASACSKPAAPPAPPAARPSPAARPTSPPLPKELADKLAPLQEKMKAEPRSFAAAVAVADALSDGGRHVEAVEAYRQALDRGAETLALLDELAAKPPAKLPEAKAAGCESAAVSAIEANDAKARTARDKGEAAPALVCARQAAVPVLAAAARRAQALFLAGNVDQAVSEYDKVLKRDPDAPEALFFLGALQLNRRNAGLAGMQAAAAAWKHFLEVAPKDHPRRAEVEKTLPQVEAAIANAPKAAATADGDGAGELPAGHPPMDGAPAKGMGMGAGMGMGMGAGHEGNPAPADLEKALGEAEAALAKGDGAAAARAYMGAMNSNPDDARVQAGLAASQFLKGSAMAQKVFEVAAARDPKAVDELAGRLQQKGNPGLARTLRQQLMVASPDYAKASDLAARAK